MEEFLPLKFVKFHCTNCGHNLSVIYDTQYTFGGRRPGTNDELSLGVIPCEKCVEEKAKEKLLIYVDNISK